jgi:hypothetical protein
MSVCMSVICMPVCVSVCMNVYLFLFISFCLSVCLKDLSTNARYYFTLFQPAKSVWLAICTSSCMPSAGTSVYQSICQSVDLSFFLSVCLFVFVSFFLSVCLFVFVSFFWSVCLKALSNPPIKVISFYFNLSGWLSVHPLCYPVLEHLSICQSVRLFVFLHIICLSVSLSVFLHIFLSVFPSV